MEPTRARPVPFCFQSLRPAPLTSLLSLVLWVPLRSPRRYQREASCKRCWFTLTPKTASRRSSCPTLLPFKLTTSTTGIISFPYFLELLIFPDFANKDVRSAGAGHRALDQQEIFVVVHFHDFQIFRGDAGIAHVTGKMLVLPHARRKRTATDAARSAVKHGTVRGVAAGVMPALHAASKTFAFAYAADVDQLARFEIFHQHAVADFGFVFRFVQADFLENFHGCRAGFLEMSGHGFVDALRLDEFHEAELRGFVAVDGYGAALHNHAGAGLQDGASDRRAVVLEDLRHSQLDSDNPVDCHARSLFRLEKLKLKSNCELLLGVAESFDFHVHAGR